MEEELQAPEHFGLCNNQRCSDFFKYLDVSVHTFVDGPDPRDHLANERNLLTWIRMGTTLALIGFITLIDLPSKNFAPSYSLPWTRERSNSNSKAVSYVFVGLGFSCILISVYNYFRNQKQIVRRLLYVGHGWLGYSIAILITLFVIFIMLAALVDGRA
ncbi:hypothetical protein BY458DRAFT_488097 [Sporodiniella umbellata]|nr:hypothetical protein BY458DRAFT_488097 [Sporodiniella umbellata]